MHITYLLSFKHKVFQGAVTLEFSYKLIMYLHPNDIYSLNRVQTSSKRCALKICSEVLHEITGNQFYVEKI